jgi:monovalent cation:H+ antiporter-2, CPA2 family
MLFRVLATPIRDMFAALFFVSLGTLMDVSLLPYFIVPALILIAVSLGTKFMTVYLAAKSQGINKLTSLRVGIGLSSSGGELALVVAKVGAEVGLRVPFYCQCCRYDYNYYLYLSIFYQIRLEIYREVC